MAKTPKNAADDRRDAPRGDVGSMLPARLIVEASGQDLSCRVVDVSADGLCVVVPESVAEGANLVFVTLPERFRLTVAWCRPDTGRSFRCGLRLAAGERDLRQVFARYLGVG